MQGCIFMKIECVMCEYLVFGEYVLLDLKWCSII
jgi:hypothetical protein